MNDFGTNRFKVKFQLESPIILRGRLYLDSVLIALAVQKGLSYEEAEANLPIPKKQGIYRCSQLLWDGLPEVVMAKKQMSIWTSNGLDDHVHTTETPFIKSNWKTYKPLLDQYPAMDIPEVHFLVETDHPEKLLAGVLEIPALGKWSRKGYGDVASVCMAPTDADPWIRDDGRPARALPVHLWQEAYGGPHALAMESITPPYWASQQAQLCAVDHIQ